MDENPRAQIDTYVPHIDGLIKRGLALRNTLEADPSSDSALASYRFWQQEIGVTINQLSGGSKAHWLARAFSEAFLVRSTTGHVVDGVASAEIITRLVGVLEQAIASLAQLSALLATAAAPETPPSPRRFEFVHNPDLRPILEQAYLDGRRALEQGNFGLALVAYCGILEAIVTDAVEHRNLTALPADNSPLGKVTDWPFETRLAVAESAGVISGGWARLPELARRYRDFADAVDMVTAQVSEQDARRAMQVLHVVMRDLDPRR